MKKNCFNCLHSEYASGDIGDPEGWICNKKDFQGKEEKKMLKSMERESYLEKAKKCCELKTFYYVGYRELFEKPERKGYTTNIKEAGKFELSYAQSIIKHSCADGYPRWLIPCSALDGFKDGKLKPLNTY